MGPIAYPYRDKFTVTWRTTKGQEITKTLDLTKAFPKPLKGTLVFTIDAQNNLGFQIE